MIYTEPLFLGITPSGARNYVANRVAALRKPLFNACAGRFSVVEAAIKTGVPPQDVYASDIGLFSSVIGYLAGPSKKLDDLGIRILHAALEPKGVNDELDFAALLGALLVSRIGLAGLSRADMPENVRRDFSLYLDEFQSFTTLSLANMLSELRKHRVNMVLAHQYLSQLDPQVRDAILGNVGSIISFRRGLPDAEILVKEFYPTFAAVDLASLPNYQIYLKLMVNGAVSRPFSRETLGPFD